jgi:exopolysaccharide biosynthesis polyprenyl glycosylphosphotransferase
MTPPPGVTHAAARVGLGRSARSVAVNRRLIHLLDMRTWGTTRLVIDLIVLYVAASAALLSDPSIHADWRDRLLVIAFPLLVLTIMHARRSFEDRLKRSLLDSTSQVLGSVSLAAMLTIALDSAFSASHPLALALRLWLFAVVYLGTERAVLMSLRRHAMSKDAFSIPTLIVGAGVIGARLVMRLTAERGYGLRPVGFLDADPMPVPQRLGMPAIPVLGGPDALLDAVQQTGARHIILAFSSEPDHVLVSKVRECQELGIEVSLVPRLYEAINDRTTLDHVGGLPLLALHSVDPRGWQFAIKHAFDRGLALLLLLLAAPAVAVIALLVDMTSPGPVFFRQRRVGRDGHEFDLFKFRTMRLPDSELDFEPEDGFAPGGIEGIDRRTRVGRVLRELSLDELPQLLNVLRGDMSLVGPRPERPEYVARFARDVARYEDRHRVKSGITGWAQVHGLRGQTSIADRVEWDNFYIQNWSLRFDLRILVLTVAEVLRLRDSA